MHWESRARGAEHGAPPGPPACPLPPRPLSAFPLQSPKELTCPRIAETRTHQFGKLPCTCLMHFTASASQNCLSFRRDNVLLSAGLPAGGTQLGGRMGFPCEIRWENKLLPDRRFAGGSSDPARAAWLSFTFSVSRLNIKGYKCG